jgi:hypothetical protein
MVKYYLLQDGKTFGPFPEVEILSMISSGRAKVTDLGCIVGENSWLPLYSIVPNLPVAPHGSTSDAMSGLIPYKNPPALAGYYLGVFSLIPCLGLPLGIAALICGIIGLRRANANPGGKGKGHAWTAIILGSLTTLLWGVGGVLMAIGMAQD